MEEWREEEEQVEEGREEVGDTRGPVWLAVIKDLPRLRGSSGYTTTKFSPHHTGEGDAKVEDWREEEEQVEEEREEVGDTRGPVWLAVIKDLPKLRGSSGYTTTILQTTPLISPQ